jgi:hypothetical protein
MGTADPYERMSRSRHPIALRLERQVGGATRLLATVMGLPLVDGIFAAVVLAGLLSTVGGIIQVGLLIFGGSATVAVILADLDGDRRDVFRSVAAVGGLLILGAGVEAAIAPTIESALNLAIFERFAALVILAIAAKTASARIGELLPRPAVIVGLGLIASVDYADFAVAVTLNSDLVLRAMAAAGVGVGFALLVAGLAPILRAYVDLDRFRFGSAVALGTLPLGLLGVIPGNAPLAVLAVTGLLAFDPDGGAAATREEPQLDDGGHPDETVGVGSDDGRQERAPWL